MQYVPYIERTKAWATTGGMRRPLTAVLLPDSLESIPTMSEYLDLLALRLEWMLDERIKEVQELNLKVEDLRIEDSDIEDLEVPPTSEQIAKRIVCREILSIVNFPTMGNLTPKTGSTWQWANVMVRDFSDFHEALYDLGMKEYPQREVFEFPLYPLEAEEAEAVRELIMETTLEEWLILMHAAITRPLLFPS